MKTLVRRLVSCTAVAALVFAQLAVAAFACPGDLGQAAPAATMQSMPGCEAMGSAPMPLCASHCADGAQSFEKPAPAGVAPAALTGTIDWPAFIALLPVHTASISALPAARPPGPPLSIRNCCLRI